MTGSTFAPEPHQKLIDGLTAMALREEIKEFEELQVV